MNKDENGRLIHKKRNLALLAGAGLAAATSVSQASLVVSLYSPASVDSSGTTLGFVEQSTSISPAFLLVQDVSSGSPTSFSITHASGPNSPNAIAAFVNPNPNSGPQNPNYYTGTTTNLSPSASGATVAFSLNVSVPGVHSDSFTLSAGNTVVVTTNVYAPPNLVANNSSTLDLTNGASTLQLQNVAGTGPTATAVTSNVVNTTGDFTITSGSLGGQTLASGQSASAQVAFDNSSNLNGTYTGQVTVNYGLQYGSSYHPGQITQTNSGPSFLPIVYNVSYTISNHTGSGSATVPAGSSLAGLSTSQTDTSGHAVTFSTLDGTAGGSDTVSISFAPSDPSNPAPGAVSNTVATLTGTGTDIVAVQLEVDNVTEIPANPMLLWLDPSDNTWKNAVLGNTPTPNPPIGYNETYFSYLASQSETGPSAADLNAYGYYVANGDLFTWAVIDHNSQFSVGSVPEPAGLWLLSLAAPLLSKRRSR